MFFEVGKNYVVYTTDDKSASGELLEHNEFGVVILVQSEYSTGKPTFFSFNTISKIIKSSN